MTDSWVTDFEHNATELIGSFYELQGWTFRWSRAKRAMGNCNHRTMTIALSLPVYSIPANRSSAHDTLLHEIAHALAGPGEGHGPKWQRLASKLGANPSRCGSVSVAPKARWLAHCRCETPSPRYRKPKASAAYWCTACGVRVRWEDTNLSNRLPC